VGLTVAIAGDHGLVRDGVVSPLARTAVIEGAVAAALHLGARGRRLVGRRRVRPSPGQRPLACQCLHGKVPAKWHLFDGRVQGGRYWLGRDTLAARLKRDWLAAAHGAGREPTEADALGPHVERGPDGVEDLGEDVLRHVAQERAASRAWLALA
jgi:hypothetical protein